MIETPGGTAELRPPLLSVEDLSKTFPSRRGWGRRTAERPAIDAVSFHIEAGETFGLVGESGCGKSTTARCILRLIEPDAGRVRFDGEDVRAMNRGALRSFRRHAQVVFQDPYGSLNPRLVAASALDEVLRVHRLGVDGGRADRIRGLLERVGLTDQQGRCYPHELSGGQRQRVGIARALAVEPRLLILDEPVSSLDVSVQAQVINLLTDLQREMGLTYLFISHDLALVEHVSDRVGVMKDGRILEVAPARDLYTTPRHPYTTSLLAASPTVLHEWWRGAAPPARG